MADGGRSVTHRGALAIYQLEDSADLIDCAPPIQIPANMIDTLPHRMPFRAVSRRCSLGLPMRSLSGRTVPRPTGRARPLLQRNHRVPYTAELRACPCLTRCKRDCNSQVPDCESTDVTQDSIPSRHRCGGIADADSFLRLSELLLPGPLQS